MFSTYQAAYEAAAAEDIARFPTPVVSGNNTPEAAGNVPYQFPQIKVTASSTVDVATVTLVFYDKSGTEMNSKMFNVGQTLTAGQSWSQDEITDALSDTEDSPSTNGVTNVASCKVVSWLAGD